MPDRQTPTPAWPDERLVNACLRGDEEAWGALVEKFKGLVFSIALKYGASQDEAADLFQSIWLDAYNDLPKLRKKGSVRSWLISLTTHRCYHWKQERRKQSLREAAEVDSDQLEEQAAGAPDFVAELEREQLVRESILELTPRCQEMIRMLFFSSPPKPYQEVAGRLGLATGSIGFIRGRCLEKLRRILERHGL